MDKKSVADRIEQAPACEVINLTEKEKSIYTGCGLKLARFENAELIALYDPLEHIPYNEDTEALANNALEDAVSWLAMAKGEIWLVMCSCYQLCEPRRITINDAQALAHMARRFGEEIAENC
jgi:hypothetical protein